MFFSLFPFLVCFILAFAYPDVLGLFKIIGLTLCNFNSYILPSLMFIFTVKNNKKMRVKMYLVCLYLGFIIIVSVIGLLQITFGF